MNLPPRVSIATPPPSARAPRFNLAPRDVANLLKELKAFHKTFSPHFQRKEQQHWSLKYMQGQMLKMYLLNNSGESGSRDHFHARKTRLSVSLPQVIEMILKNRTQSH
ncbi:MAG: hypothetical protein FJ009_22170 [Chloroflexi bacterium]|nr:hypothetical protein [Chloroflexota bacterium]